MQRVTTLLQPAQLVAAVADIVPLPFTDTADIPRALSQDMPRLQAHPTQLYLVAEHDPDVTGSLCPVKLGTIGEEHHTRQEPHPGAAHAV